MDTNLDILDELNKGCSMGIEVLDMILKKVEEHDFRDLLVEFYDEYIEYSDQITSYYHELSDEEIHKVNLAEKMMAWYGIMKDTILDDSTSKIADLLINGTTMGVIEGRRILNHKKMDKKIHSLCDKYIKMQEKYIEKLKDYL